MDSTSEFMLNAAVYAPFVFAFVLTLFWNVSGGKTAAAMGLVSVAISFAGALWACSGFVSAGANAAVFADAAQIWIFPKLCLSAISAPMLFLAATVSLAATVYSLTLEIKNAKLYYLLLLIMQGGLFGAFTSANVLWMYMFHEFALVPTFVAMLLWGSAGKRMAAMQMAIYLTLGALVSLIGIIAVYAATGAASFNLDAISAALVSRPISENAQVYIFAMLMFGLGTLVSLFPFYTWAPRTYACAPTAFAMLHAGVLKKFGLFMLIQFAVPVLPYGCAHWAQIMAVFALFNVIYIGFITLAQRDIKLMVSYSSVGHMGICFLGIASMSVLGAGGALIMMVGHGLSVALMLMLSNIIINRTDEWDMTKMGGLYKQTPVLAAFFIAGTLATLGLPFFANFWGEIAVLTSLWGFSPVICALGATGLIFSAIYGLRAVARVFMGTPSENLAKNFSQIADVSKLERLAASLLVAALIFAGVCPNLITKPADTLLKSFPAYTQGK